MKKFNIKAMKPISPKRKEKILKVDPKDFFKHKEKITRALSQALIEGDQEAFQDIIMGYMNIINKEKLAKVSKLPIATIRRVAAGSNCNIETLLKITAAINKAA